MRRSFGATWPAAPSVPSTVSAVLAPPPPPLGEPLTAATARAVGAFTQDFRPEGSQVVGWVFHRHLAGGGPVRPSRERAVFKLEVVQAQPDDLVLAARTHIFSSVALGREGQRAHTLQLSEEFRFPMARAGMQSLAFSALHPTVIAFEALIALASQVDVLPDMYHHCFLFSVVCTLEHEATALQGIEGAFLSLELWTRSLSGIQQRGRLQDFVSSVAGLQTGFLAQQLAVWEVRLDGFKQVDQSRAVEETKERYLRTFRTLAAVTQVRTVTFHPLSDCLH